MKKLILILCIYFIGAFSEVSASLCVYYASPSLAYSYSKPQKAKKYKKMLRQHIKLQPQKGDFISVVIAYLFVLGMLGGGLIWLFLRLFFSALGAWGWWVLAGGILVVLGFLLLVKMDAL